MRVYKKRSRGFWTILVLGVLMGGLLRQDMVMTVRAETENTAFSIDAQMMPSDGEKTYKIRLTIENLGADWEGTARLMVEEDYRKPSAYDTVISLPQGSKKQFVVKVPTDSINDTDGTVSVTLLDKKSQKSAEKEFKRLLSGGMEALSMGILSDDYTALTYLDMGGEQIYYYGEQYPIKLVELRQDNLEDLLDSLEFLVIDNYNTGVLTDEEMEDIRLWNDNGGVLIIGTGASGEDTLSGFENGYLGVSCTGIYAPEDIEQNIFSTSVDLSRMTLAKLQGVNSNQINAYSGAWAAGGGSVAWAVGDGSVAVLPYALTELGEMQSDFYRDYTQESFVMELLNETSSYADARYTRLGYYDSFGSYIIRMLEVLGNSNSPLRFGVLKALVIGYVILAGPVCYLVLRFLKKRELYWVAVPAMAFVAIGLVFLAGRGFEVVSTRVYSVTVEDLSGKGGQKTYLYCYDANRKEWELRMAEGYEYAGGMSWSYQDSLDSEAYYYRMRTEGDTLYVGMNPTSNFEDGYFYVSGSGGQSVEGELGAEKLRVDWFGMDGTVTNGTDRDLKYFAVVTQDVVYVYENLPAGGICDLGTTAPLYWDTQSSLWSSYMFDFLYDIVEEGERQKISDLSALGAGIWAVYPQLGSTDVLVIGVTEDWEKTVDDSCSEISYGCLYMVQ